MSPHSPYFKILNNQLHRNFLTNSYKSLCFCTEKWSNSVPHSDVIHIVRFRFWDQRLSVLRHHQGDAVLFSTMMYLPHQTPFPRRMRPCRTTQALGGSHTSTAASLAVTLRPRRSSHLKMKAFLQQQYSNFITTKLMIIIKVMIIIIKYFKIEKK